MSSTSAFASRTVRFRALAVPAAFTLFCVNAAASDRDYHPEDAACRAPCEVHDTGSKAPLPHPLVQGQRPSSGAAHTTVGKRDNHVAQPSKRS